MVVDRAAKMQPWHCKRAMAAERQRLLGMSRARAGSTPANLLKSLREKSYRILQAIMLGFAKLEAAIVIMPIREPYRLSILSSGSFWRKRIVTKQERHAANAVEDSPGMVRR